MSDTREIVVPANLYAAAENKFGSNFRTVDELVVFILRELVDGDTIRLDRADQERIEQRLKDLGYM